MIKRRDFIKNTLFLTTNLALTSLPLISFAAPKFHLNKEITIGIFSPSHCAAPLIFAEKKGYFKDAELRVKLINYPTMSTLGKDLVAGNIDLGQLTVPMAFAIHTGSNSSKLEENLVMPMILGVHGSNLMVSKDSEIIRPADFKGKTIATHTRLTVHYLLVRLYLQRNGVDTENDVNMSIVNLNDLTSVLQQGEIDAFMMPEPANALAEETGKATTYILNQYIWRYHPCCGLTATKSLFDRDRNKIRALVSATSRASLYINKERNREELVSVLRKTPYGFELLSRKVIDLAFAFSRSSFYPFPYQSTAVFLLRMMRDYKLLSTIDVDRIAHEVFLSDFMRECLIAIGKKAPRKNTRPEIVFGRPLELET
jgi:ABC-type nitrate/sulfonate/bicarbonate transport system substrate-binding protein